MIGNGMALTLKERQLVQACLQSQDGSENQIEELARDPGINWDRLGALADAAEAGPLLWSALSGTDCLPVYWEGRLGRRYQERRVHNWLWLRQLGQMMEELWQSRIPVVVLGPASWHGTAYPDLACCPLTSLDLGVAAPHLASARRVLMARGYSQESTSGPIAESGNDYATLTRPIFPSNPVHLHWRLIPCAQNDERRVREWLWATVRPTTIQNRPATILGPAGQLLRLGSRYQNPGCLSTLFLLHQATTLIRQHAQTLDWSGLVTAAQQIGCIGPLFRMIHHLFWNWQAPFPESAMGWLWEFIRQQQTPRVQARHLLSPDQRVSTLPMASD